MTPTQQSVHGAITSPKDAATVIEAQPTYAPERPGMGLVAWLLAAVAVNIAVVVIILSIVLS